jgi:hypothetical protein
MTAQDALDILGQEALTKSYTFHVSSGGRDGPHVGEGADFYYITSYEYLALYLAIKDGKIVYRELHVASL